MLDFLPLRILSAVRHVNLNYLYELRMRADKPLRCNLSGVYRYLGESGVVGCSEKAIYPTREEIEETLYAASGYSVYTVENQIRQGFVTGKEGERIGIAGSFVYENGSPLSIRAITSLCIRIPHAVKGCAEEIYSRCLCDEIRSLLILSPPGLGKTTILRDLARLVSERRELNVLVSDERGELSAGDLGACSDVMKFADKLTAFTAGIRAMRPDVIVTDELLSEDYPAVRRAVESGITVFASAHLTRREDVPDRVFLRYITLNGLG
ncbi:MAG: hypothetical protein K2H43_04410, partial [Clostridia bacterium]|nr:hypothetical protein [Clostridia bacterium]